MRRPHKVSVLWFDEAPPCGGFVPTRFREAVFVMEVMPATLCLVAADASRSAPDDPLPLATAEGSSQGGFDIVSTTSNHTGFNIVIVAGGSACTTLSPPSCQSS